MADFIRLSLLLPVGGICNQLQMKLVGDFVKLTTADSQQTFLVQPLFQQTAHTKLDDVGNSPTGCVEMILQRRVEHSLLAFSCGYLDSFQLFRQPQSHCSSPWKLIASKN
jgi:hypothetical protein